MPGRGVNMGDGWETKRSRREGPDWVVVRLATEGAIERVLVDTLHFKGNAPDFCAIDVTNSDGDPDGSKDDGWLPLLSKTSLQPHTEHRFDTRGGPATHVRLRIWPDGGISRLRLFGVATDAGRERAGMRYVRAMPEPELETVLRSCCASTRWIAAMVKERPFDSLASMKARAGELWNKLSTPDFDEAFKAHPRIGEKKADSHQSATAHAWSTAEQAKVGAASEAVLTELMEANKVYGEKFGRIYIVCATGKSAEEMLAIAKERIQNTPDVELKRAADEQRKITELRLEKMVRE